MTKSSAISKLILIVLAAAIYTAAPVAANEALFKENCSKCHADDARLMARLKKLTPEERTAKLNTFLPRHHAPGETTRTAIIEYLMKVPVQ